MICNLSKFSSFYLIYKNHWLEALDINTLISYLTVHNISFSFDFFFFATKKMKKQQKKKCDINNKWNTNFHPKKKRATKKSLKMKKAKKKKAQHWITFVGMFYYILFRICFLLHKKASLSLYMKRNSICLEPFVFIDFSGLKSRGDKIQ